MQKISVEALGLILSLQQMHWSMLKLLARMAFSKVYNSILKVRFRGQYSATFRPKLPGAYELKYKLTSFQMES